MFATPLSLILVYILSIINFFILLLPEILFAIMLYFIGGYTINIYEYKNLFLVLIFIISLATIAFMVIDFFFGIYVNSFARHCHDYRVDSKYKFLGEIFEDIKKKYKNKKVELLIYESSEINAFALASFRKKYIILSLGIISNFAIKSMGNEKKFSDSIRGVIGHEMSHLVNKDYISGLLLEINKKIIFSLQNYVARFLNTLAALLSIIPIVGIIATLFVNLFFFLNNLSLFFYNYIVIRIYYIFKAAISRSIEYRSDRQSAKVNGGDIMAYSLSLLPGDNGYSTIFSTHPKTSKRIKRALKIKKSKVRISLLTKLSNILAIFGIFYICYYCGAAININEMIKIYFISITNLLYIIKKIFFEILSTIGF